MVLCEYPRSNSKRFGGAIIRHQLVFPQHPCTHDCVGVTPPCLMVKPTLYIFISNSYPWLIGENIVKRGWKIIDGAVRYNRVDFHGSSHCIPMFHQKSEIPRCIVTYRTSSMYAIFPCIWVIGKCGSIFQHHGASGYSDTSLPSGNVTQLWKMDHL